MSKITIIGINFYPENSSTGLYTSQMAEYLSKEFDVNVITAFPYYPQWEIRPEYKNKKRFHTEQYNNIKIFRYKQYVPKKPSFLKRILHIIDFTFGAFVNIFKIKNTDLVIAIDPVTFALLPAFLLAKKKKAKFWIHVQDFEFDAAVEAGFNNGFFKKIFFKIILSFERWIFNRADITSSISNSMVKKLQTKCKTKNYYFPNWIDVNDSISKSNKKHKYLSSNKFKILYSGNIGAKQDWDFFYKIINQIDDDGIEFIVVGDGAKRYEFEKEIQGKKNVILYPPVAYEDLANLLNSADLHILFQKANVIDSVMPSKLLGMMASAKPSIVTGNKNSETYSLFEKINKGLFIEAGDERKVIEKIYGLKSDKNLCAEIGKRSREIVTKEFNRLEILENLAKKCRELIEQKSDLNKK